MPEARLIPEGAGYQARENGALCFMAIVFSGKNALWQLCSEAIGLCAYWQLCLMANLLSGNGAL